MRIGSLTGSLSQLLSQDKLEAPKKSQIISTIVEGEITTPIPQPSQRSRIVVEASFIEEDEDYVMMSQSSDSLTQEIPIHQPQIQPQRNSFFERASAAVSIRSFREALRHLNELESTPENLTSIRTCRALERLVIKTQRRGASRNASLQNIENARQARARGDINQALKELIPLFTNINATSKPEIEAPTADANIFVKRKFMRQDARIEGKDEIVANLARQVKNLVVENLNEQLKGLKTQDEYDKDTCISDQAIDIYKEINQVINGTRPNSNGHRIEQTLNGAKSEDLRVLKVDQVCNQLQTLASQLNANYQDLYDQFHSITEVLLKEEFTENY